MDIDKISIRKKSVFIFTFIYTSHEKYVSVKNVIFHYTHTTNQKQF